MAVIYDFFADEDTDLTGSTDWTFQIVSPAHARTRVLLVYKKKILHFLHFLHQIWGVRSVGSVG